MPFLFHMFPFDSNWFCDETARKDGANGEVCKTQLMQTFDGKATLCALSAAADFGKSCLLFQSAVSYASKGISVAYICKDPLGKMPFGVHGMPKPDAKVLNTVRFLYMTNVEELIQYCATVHTKVVYPDVLLIDDIDIYIEQLKDTSLDHGCARVCALLVDTLHFINEKRNNTPICQLMVTFKERASSHHLSHVFSKFGFALARLEETEEDRTFLLSMKSRKSVLNLRYQIQREEIFLHHVQITEEL